MHFAALAVLACALGAATARPAPGGAAATTPGKCMAIDHGPFTCILRCLITIGFAVGIRDAEERYTHVGEPARLGTRDGADIKAPGA